MDDYIKETEDKLKNVLLENVLTASAWVMTDVNYKKIVNFKSNLISALTIYFSYIKC